MKAGGISHVANFGQPDYTDVVTDEEKKALRERVMATTLGTGMYEWPKEAAVKPGYPPDHVQTFCVQDSAWQRIRLSMKGKATHEKLEILWTWWRNMHATEPYATEVQVGNYLGALRRGGQLDQHNHIRRWR
jgi:hypothetical protein